MNSPWLKRLTAAGFIMALMVGGYYAIRAPGPPESPPDPAPPESTDRSVADPRLAYAGPYRNVHPDVKYVGDAACADCHADRCDTFRDHPMGRSLFPIDSSPTLPPIDVRSRNPFAALGARFRIERRDGRTRHYEFRIGDRGDVLYERPFDVKYVVGSATHGQSFLSERDGYLLQTPVSWYSQKQIWDASPGWREVAGGRLVEGRCLYCHANRVEPIAGHINRYAEPIFRGHAIGCERCHGPAEKHVARWTGKEPVEPGQDFTIVNPARLDPPLRDAVCQQCHLEGETRFPKRGRGLHDFRPGLPLEQFWAIAVHAEEIENFNVVNHVEQMWQSRCFKKSADTNKLGCISCHDPHWKPAGEERIAHFRDRCLKCHDSAAGQLDCALSLEERRRQHGNSCVACHMPRQPAADVPHVAGTDHRILRRPIVLDAVKHREPMFDEQHSPLRLFHRAGHDRLTAEDRRDLGIALAEAADQDKIHARYAMRAIALLETALTEAPDDAAAWEAKGAALSRANRARDAYRAFQEALRCEPNRETSLVGAAYMAMRLDLKNEAVALWQRAVERNPYALNYRVNLSVLFATQQNWQAARPHLDQWVEMDPGSVEARRLRAQCRLRLGDRAAAAQDYATIEALKPPNIAEIRTWWAAQTR